MSTRAPATHTGKEGLEPDISTGFTIGVLKAGLHWHALGPPLAPGQ
jgi:hypothetical protein